MDETVMFVNKSSFTTCVLQNKAHKCLRRAQYSESSALVLTLLTYNVGATKEATTSRRDSFIAFALPLGRFFGTPPLSLV